MLKKINTTCRQPGCCLHDPAEPSRFQRIPPFGPNLANGAVRELPRSPVEPKPPEAMPPRPDREPRPRSDALELEELRRLFAQVTRRLAALEPAMAVHVVASADH